MRSELGDLAEETIREIRRTIPGITARPGERDERLVRRGVVHALSTFVDRVADPQAPAGLDPRTAQLYRALGRDRMLEGHDLEALQAAYRLGARIAWRRWVALGRQAGIPAARMYQLAEAVFEYIDELATRTAEGYREAQRSVTTEELEQRRRLLELLLTAQEVPARTIRELSRSARWPLPDSVVAVALLPRPRRDALAAGPAPWGSEALADTHRADPFLLLPARPASPKAEWERRLRGWRAAIGPAVPVSQAAASARRARKLLDLAQHGLGDGRRVVHCDDHLSTLILLDDDALIRRLAEHTLAPLAKLTPKQRDRLAETMLTCLESGGSAPEVARRMCVHPQTVRYRLRQIEELYGEGWRDPGARFDLEIALRVRVLLDKLSGGGRNGTVEQRRKSAGAARGAASGHGRGGGPPVP
ncbi:PucR family transcriptional regulator [Streptomyces sp. NPDC054796]